MHRDDRSWRSRRRLAKVIVLALATLPVAARVHAQSADSGSPAKTMKLIVGMPPGGGVDAYARLVQRHLPRLLPGTPSIVVQHMPGAGSLRAVMALASAPDDGATIVTFSSSLIMEAILAPERIKVDFKSFAYLGNISEDIRVCFVRRALAVTGWTDLQSRRQVIFGATAAGASGNIDAAILARLLGLDTKTVQGYAGSAAKRLALESGEIDGDCAGWTSLPSDWVPSGRVDVVVRMSPTLLPGLSSRTAYGGDLTGNASDRRLYEFLIAPERLGRLFMTSGKVAPNHLAGMRRAFEAMMREGEFLADAQKFALTVTPMSGIEVERDIAALYAMPPDLIARAKAIASE